MTIDLTAGFTLALGGGGARGYAHLGVAEALLERGLEPGLIVGTSMGAVLGAGLAAGIAPRQILRDGYRLDVWRSMRWPGWLALADHRPLIEQVCANIGDPLIEDLPIRFAAAVYDMATGRLGAVTSGRLSEALVRARAIPVVFSPVAADGGIWVDAGSWETVPVSTARALSPAPVLGVLVMPPKPAVLESGPVAWSLGLGARLLDPGREDGRRVSARRYASLIAARMAAPVVHEAPDWMIRPNLLGVTWVRFGATESPFRRGYRAAQRSLDGH